MAVNLSTGEIDRPDLVADVMRIRRETGLPAGALKLEVTESDVMRDPDRAAIILGNLREAGAAGAGRFRHRLLVAQLSDAPALRHSEDRSLFRARHGHQRGLGQDRLLSGQARPGRLALEVVAEGVENAQMARQLLSLGCDYGQGFGYAPALSSQEAEVYLNESYVDGAAPVKARG